MNKTLEKFLRGATITGILSINLISGCSSHREPQFPLYDEKYFFSRGGIVEPPEVLDNLEKIQREMENEIQDEKAYQEKQYSGTENAR